MFLTYQEYKELGYSAIDEADFPRLEDDAADYILEKTHGQAALGKGHDKRLKKATAKVAERLQSEEQSGMYSGIHGAVVSESIGKVSTSYASTDAKTSMELSEAGKYKIVESLLMPTGWLYSGVSTCVRNVYSFPLPPAIRPPTDGDGGNNGGDEDMASKHCDVYYLLGSFKGGFDEYGNTLTFPGGPVRWDCAAGSGEVTVAPGTITYAHGTWFLFDITQGDNAQVTAGAWPTDPNVYVCGYMHNNGPKKIIEIFGMGTQVWEA